SSRPSPVFSGGYSVKVDDMDDGRDGVVDDDSDTDENDEDCDEDEMGRGGRSGPVVFVVVAVVVVVVGSTTYVAVVAVVVAMNAVGPVGADALVSAALAGTIGPNRGLRTGMACAFGYLVERVVGTVAQLSVSAPRGIATSVLRARRALGGRKVDVEEEYDPAPVPLTLASPVCWLTKILGRASDHLRAVVPVHLFQECPERVGSLKEQALHERSWFYRQRCS
ncbi:hypothetical protein BGW38_005768, partial [Lunasporangiospora selenospora]